jgi:hypothetical protein
MRLMISAIFVTQPGDGQSAPSTRRSVKRLAEVPGMGVDSAQQAIAEVGATAATFPSEKHLSSRVGACPGDEESADVNRSRRSPQGNRHMRRILNQAANAAVKHKGSIFENLYRRYVSRLGHNQSSRIIAHKLCRLVWKILHRGIRYEERGPGFSGMGSGAKITCFNLNNVLEEVFGKIRTDAPVGSSTRIARPSDRRLA